MQNERIIDSSTFGNDKIEIVEVPALHGANSAQSARGQFYMQKSGVTLKFVRVKLGGGKLTTESGALYYLKGRIDSHVPTGGVGGVARRLFNSALTQERAFNPEYTGNGEVVLEPSFGHYILLELSNESFIVDKGLYYCSIGNINVQPFMQNNVSSAIFGGEGLFQTMISGTGSVVLSINVPMEEIEIFNLENEKVQVDGNFAILRSSTINFTVQQSTRSLFGTMVSGEGLLQTFEGTGMVWIAPTSPVYERMDLGGMRAVDRAVNSSNSSSRGTSQQGSQPQPTVSVQFPRR